MCRGNGTTHEPASLTPFCLLPSPKLARGPQEVQDVVAGTGGVPPVGLPPEGVGAQVHNGGLVGLQGASQQGTSEEATSKGVHGTALADGP